MSGLDVLIGNLGSMGFFDFMLPFFLFTAIVYGILTKEGWISSEVTVNGTIAILFSFSLLNYTPLGNYFSTLFGMGAMLIGGLLVLGMSGRMIGLKPEELFLGNKKIMGLSLLIILITVFAAAGMPGFAGGGAMNEGMLSVILFFVGMGVVVYILNSK